MPDVGHISETECIAICRGMVVRYRGRYERELAAVCEPATRRKDVRIDLLHANDMAEELRALNAQRGIVAYADRIRDKLSALRKLHVVG